jgi:uncharacterized protein YbjT (DUF2867 family)
LNEAFAGAQVVVDVANSPSFEDQAVLEFFEQCGRHILAAEREANVGHHVALSVVGTERLLESGYFRAKLAQENLITAAQVPYTIVRATQFFEFLGWIADASAAGDEVRLSTALMQPIAAEDVAAALAQIAVAAPTGGIVELAGPERLPIDEAVRRIMMATKDPRRIIADAHARYYGVALDDRSLTPDDGSLIGPTSLEEWLQARA